MGGKGGEGSSLHAQPSQDYSNALSARHGMDNAGDIYPLDLSVPRGVGVDVRDCVGCVWLWLGV